MTKQQSLEIAIQEVMAKLPFDEVSLPTADDRKLIEILFDAGAAWQRERDAEIAEQHAIEMGPTQVKTMGGWAVAKKIREQSFDITKENTDADT